MLRNTEKTSGLIPFFLSVLFGGDCERVGWLLSSGSGWKLLPVEIWEVWYGNLSQVSSVKGSMTAFPTSL